MPLPKHLYHATPLKFAEAIATGGLQPRSGAPAYLCMSGKLSGATTLGRQSSDIVFRVETTQAMNADWVPQGAGKAEWRSKEGIAADCLKYVRYSIGREYLRRTKKLRRDNPIPWKEAKNFPAGLNSADRSNIAKFKKAN
jgi:RNA:NAD 2'-phosphotransferase (TPT1/KptA family)